MEGKFAPDAARNKGAGAANHLGKKVKASAATSDPPEPPPPPPIPYGRRFFYQLVAMLMCGMPPSPPESGASLRSACIFAHLGSISMQFG